MADPTKSLNDIPYNLKEQDSVIIGVEDVVACIATRRDMIRSALELNS